MEVKEAVLLDSEFLKERSKKDRIGVILNGSIKAMGCCGMEEISFMELQEKWEKYKDLPTNEWEELIAKYVRCALPEQDHRIVVVGVPVTVGGHSMYNIDFFTKVKETLEGFGFRQIGREYKNQNSGNTIVVLAAQL